MTNEGQTTSGNRNLDCGVVATPSLVPFNSELACLIDTHQRQSGVTQVTKLQGRVLMNAYLCPDGGHAFVPSGKLFWRC